MLLTPGETTHVPVLNSLRAIAALSVCLFHYVCTVVGYTTNEIILSTFYFGQYGVQMFFVISGFIIPWSMYHGNYRIRNFFTFTAKRLIRLEPPYLISLGLAILHTYLRSFSPQYNGIDITPDANQIFLHFGYLIPFFEDEKWIRPVYWTLAVEFQYYVTIGLMFPLIISKKIVLRIAFYSAFLFSVFYTNDAFLPYHLPIFLLGILLFLKRIYLVGEIEFYLVSLSCFIFIIWKHDIPTTLFSFIAYFSILHFSGWKNKVGDFLGNISYSLYLFHSLSGMIILNYFAHFVTSPVIKTLLVLVAVMAAIAFAWVINKLVEEPSKKWSSKIKYNR